MVYRTEKNFFLLKILIIAAAYMITTSCVNRNGFGQSPIILKDNNDCQVNNGIVSDKVSDTILLPKNISKIELDYWNVFSKYESYVFSFSQISQQFSIKAGFPEDSPLMEIKSDSDKRLFINSISRYYILKTDKIVKKKEKRKEIILSDFETISIDIYTYKGERKYESTKLVSEVYIYFFDPDYELFIKMLKELILQYNQLY